MTDSIHRHTPSLTVFDSRGMTVRQTAYYRAQLGLDAEACVHAQVYDSQGRAIEVWDPRLFESRSTQPDLQPNLATVYSLSGAVLCRHSVDAGAALSLSAESGAVLEQWDARATHWRTEYDDYPRPVAIHEQMAGEPRRTCERFTYAGSDTESALRNQCGQLIRGDDGAGTLAVTEYGLLGGILTEERRLLNLIEPPDWPQSADERDALLEPGQGAITGRQFDATGTAISTTNARGHLQSMGLNIAGQLAQVMLTLNNSSPLLLLRDVQYNANSQITSQTAGNGVISQYRYHETDGRLHTLHTTRPANDPLQLLTYGHDPVGNVTSISDDAQAVRHFANQRIEPINRYTYDSFYQLVEAQGRDTAKVSSGPQLPDMQPLPIDSSQWLNFTERYRYDSAGNLTQLRHEGSQPYTRDFEVDGSSNRALIKLEGSTPPDVASGFDASGNQQRLSPGQTMSWDARNRLLKVTPVSRKDADDDAERYVYDSSGQRVRKIGTSAARAASHTREVRYLPGLELRSDSANDEQLEVIVIQAGRCAVRCLHWLSGRPVDIENDQLRYSVDDHLGSSTLELDGTARLISHEGYYPFGGTAWWAAHSAIEAKYKVVRYSGKERDASGLYYYGLRYYAPWLMRWISADPEGFVDGLNLYRTVRNNPINRIDKHGADSQNVLGLTDTQLYSVMGIAFVLISLVIAGFQAVWGASKPAVRTRKISQEAAFVRSIQDDYSLSFVEGSDVVDFMQEHGLGKKQMRLHKNSRGDITVYGLKNPQLREFFDKNKDKDDLPTIQAPRLQIRTGIALEELQARRGSGASLPPASSTPASKVQAFDVAGSSLIRRVLTSAHRRGSNASQGSGSGVAAASAVDAPRSTAPAPRTVDIGDFFTSSVFQKAAKKFEKSGTLKGESLEEYIGGVINNYVEFNQGHSHTVGGNGQETELSLDLTKLGSGGRGAWRLLLKKGPSGSWIPHRIGDTH